MHGFKIPVAEFCLVDPEVKSAFLKRLLVLPVRKQILLNVVPLITKLMQTHEYLIIFTAQCFRGNMIALIFFK